MTMTDYALGYLPPTKERREALRLEVAEVTHDDAKWAPKLTLRISELLPLLDAQDALDAMYDDREPYACGDCGSVGKAFTTRKVWTDCGYEYDVTCDTCQSSNTGEWRDIFAQVVNERDELPSREKILAAFAVTMDEWLPKQSTLRACSNQVLAAFEKRVKQ